MVPSIASSFAQNLTTLRVAFYGRLARWLRIKENSNRGSDAP